MVHGSGALGLFGNAQSRALPSIKSDASFLPAHRLRRPLNSKVERPVVGRLDGWVELGLRAEDKARGTKYDDFAAVAQSFVLNTRGEVLGAMAVIDRLS